MAFKVTFMVTRPNIFTEYFQTNWNSYHEIVDDYIKIKYENSGKCISRAYEGWDGLVGKNTLIFDSEESYKEYRSDPYIHKDEEINKQYMERMGILVVETFEEI